MITVLLFEFSTSAVAVILDLSDYAQQSPYVNVVAYLVTILLAVPSSSMWRYSIMTESVTV